MSSSKVLKGDYYFTGKNGIEVGPFPATVLPEAECKTEARQNFMKKAKARNSLNDGIFEVEFNSGVQVKACNVKLVTIALDLS